MAEIGSKFGLGGGGGIHFKNPWEFYPYMGAVAVINIYDSGGTVRDASTTNFFTQMANAGLQDTTNWTANTYKTLLTVASGKGFVAAMIGCTAGGAETTTFEITVDGVLTEIAVGTLASGERAMLLTGYFDDVDQTTALACSKPVAVALEADKATFGSFGGVNLSVIPPWRSMRGIPLLKFSQSLLIRAKHSATITNSTATAYSAIMYRVGL